MLGDLAISIGILVGLLAFGTPLPFCFGGALMYMVLCTDIGSMSGLFLWGFEQLVNPVLLCIPLFVFAGALMSESGIADALLKLCDLVLLIIYFIFKHILLAQNRPESDADGSEVTESLSVIPFQVLSNWKIPDSSSLPFSDNSKLLHPDSNQENTREYVPARHDHLLLQAKTF